MNILKRLKFLIKPNNKKEISLLLLFLAKITIKILENKNDNIKTWVLKINKNIDSFDQNISSPENASPYIHIIKGIKEISELLENISFEMYFHKIPSNTVLKTLINNLEKTLILLSKLILSDKKTIKKSALNIEIKQISAQTFKEIKLAKTDISNEKDNFIENLKFSSIYDRIESCFVLTDDINEAIISLTN